MKKFGLFISKNREAILIISVFLMLLSIFGMAQTNINYDMLTYLPSNLDTVKGQKILDKTFNNATMSMLIIENMEAKDVVKIKDRISNVTGVERVIWVSDLLDTSIPKEMLPDDLKETFYRENSTILFIKMGESASSQTTQNAVDEIRKIAYKQCFLSGASALVKDTKDLADRETPIYVGLAVILCLIVLSLSLESYAVPFIFIISIGIAVLFNMGTNVFLGEISYITKALAGVLQLGVTMDYSIFLLHRYEEEKLKINDKNEAMAQAIAATFSAITGSSLTTIAGFLALCVMSLDIGRDIGVVMAKGVLIGVICTVTILPAMILTFDGLIHKYKHKVLLPQFNKTADFVIKHYKTFVAVFLIAFIPALYGKLNANMYYNLDETLPDNLPSVAAINKLKKDYDMTCIHMIIVNENIPSYKMKKMINSIEEVDGIEKVIAYDKLLGDRIPESFIPEEVKNNFKKDGYSLILATSKYKASTDEENMQVEELNKIVKSYDKEGLIAGEASLTKDLIEVADSDFKKASFASIAAIFVIILLVFYSASLPVILVSCIELSIFINLALPYYTGKVIPFTAPIVIGCVQLGATVDYAILLSTRFREEIRNGYNKFDAMIIAVQGSARSIVTSALTFFAATIGVGVIAKIELLKTICRMLGLGALISMAVILLILPSVLLVLEGVINATSRNWNKKPQLKIKLSRESE